ncbi:hypothetical protein [Liquorilactobacillus uvarum]|uniref:hypothetical protein n=1 Tax=Liquorilactobacillus uvarum TaxID=303240 RepID=UPI00070BA3A9|nr:hypothetical protein [Liquorilactobacillus uvarum]
MKIYLKITDKMVKNYIRQYNDQNLLHTGSDKIIPGNLLVDRLEEYCTSIKKDSLRYLRIKFSEPLYTDERILIEITTKNFTIKRIQSDKTVLLAFGSWK